MGYDDNTPLTGVTGGGLPSEIWQEVMVRVHEGLPARPLPMIRVRERPVDEGFGAGAGTGQQDRPAQQERPARQEDRNRPIENILRKLLGGG